jgi:polyisoprenoid-binding protein YceI
MTTLTKTELQTFVIDPSHSRVGFTVRHMGFSKVRGSFEAFEGTVRMASGELSSLEAHATIQAASITTNEPKRDAHLRSGDFFEVETHPTLEFRSSGVKHVDGGTFTLAGELTMHGVTKAVELKGEFLGEGQDPWGGTRVAFEARTEVNRKEFGLNWNTILETGGVLVSETVEITLEVQAVLQNLN